MNNNIKILLLEDEYINSVIVKKYLHDYENLNVATNEEEFITLMNSEEFDIIFMDINLGFAEKSGLEILEELKVNNPNIKAKFIALTAFAMPGDKEKLLSQGFHDYIAKPVSRQKLLDAINKNL